MRIINFEMIQTFGKSQVSIMLGLSCSSKIPFGSQTISELLLSGSINVLQQACKVTSSKNKQIGAYPIGLTFPGRLICPNGATTLSLMTLSIMTLRIITLSTMTLSIMNLA